MAGGMSHRGDPILGNLQQRIDRTRAEEAARAAGAEVPRPLHGTDSRLAHSVPKFCWLNVTTSPGFRMPAILIDWRRRSDGGWEALVCWVSGGGRDEPEVHVRWMRSEHVRPADAPP